MKNCQPSLFSFGDPLTGWIAQHLQYEPFTPIVQLISSFGHISIALFILALSYWLWHKRLGKALLYGLFANMLLNVAIKNVIKECRPNEQFWLHVVDSYSFPSGHAQVSIYLWCGLAYITKEKWISFIFIMIGLLIALSRAYLGVHYLHDVIAGALIGIMVLALTLILEKHNFTPFSSWPLSVKTLLMLGLLSIYQYVIHDPRAAEVAILGCLFGFWLGCQLELRYVNFTVPKTLPTIVQHLLIGSMVLVLLYLSGNYLSHQLAHNAAYAKYLLYFLIGFWIAFGAPLTNHKSKIAR